jgi:hypothetical protein
MVADIPKASNLVELQDASRQLLDIGLVELGGIEMPFRGIGPQERLFGIFDMPAWASSMARVVHVALLTDAPKADPMPRYVTAVDLANCSMVSWILHVRHLPLTEELDRFLLLWC